MRHADGFAVMRAAAADGPGVRRRCVRAVLCVVCLAFVGCRTTPVPPDVPFALHPDEARLAKALAHYAAGLLLEGSQGRGPESLAAFEAAAELDPARQRIRSRIALSHLMQRRPDAAIAALEESVRLNPDDPTIRRDLAVLCQLTGRFDDAVKHFEAVLRLTPDTPDLYTTLARIHVHTGNDAAAAEALGRGLTVCGQQPTLLSFAMLRAQQLIEQEAYEAALPYIEALLSANAPQRTHLLSLAGQIQAALDRPADAASSFEAATREPDANAETYIQLGMAYLDQDRLAAAITAMEAGRKRFPASLPLVMTLAITHGASPYPDQALPLYETWRMLRAEAGDASPPPVSFYMRYVSAAARSGRHLKVETLLAECIAAHPDAHEALNYLAYTWAEQDENLDRAETYVKRALELAPDNGAYLDTMGWVHYRRGDYEAALKAVGNAHAVMPNDPVITEHMGDIHDALGNRAEALDFWSQSLRLDPANLAVRVKLEALGGDPEAILKLPPPRNVAPAKPAEAPAAPTP